MTGGRPYFRVDFDVLNGRMNVPHLNAYAPPDASRTAQILAQKLDHMEISPEAYNLLKNMNNTAKYVRIAGTVLLATAIVLDVLEIAAAIEADKAAAEQKMGRTITAVASIGGRWAGGIGGAKLGAAVGSTIGTMILPGVGTLVGGAVGGLVLGIAGSYAGSELGKWIVDITNVEEWFS